MLTTSLARISCFKFRFGHYQELLRMIYPEHAIGMALVSEMVFQRDNALCHTLHYWCDHGSNYSRSKC
jgi:hypothetical protein